MLDSLQSEGYKFVPLSELLGQTRAQLMPEPSVMEMRWARIEGQAFDFQGASKKIVGILFLWAIYLTLARSLFFGALAVLQSFAGDTVILIPVFTHPLPSLSRHITKKVIVRTVESILHNGYEDLELLVVDDGSKDETLQVCGSISAIMPR